MVDWQASFTESALDSVLRDKDRELWEKTFSELGFQAVKYQSASLDYQLSYQRGKGGQWTEISCILRWNREPLAIWPLSISRHGQQAGLNSQGLPVMPPAFVKGCAKSIRKQVVADCLKLANRTALDLGLAEWQSASSFDGQPDLNEWHLLAMAKGARCKAVHDLFVDLKLSPKEIKACFRKSFRSLVTSGAKLWSVEILRAPGNPAVWQEFCSLHLQASGRVTRSKESWGLQFSALQAGRAFLVVLRDQNQRMVGGGFFEYSKDQASYSVGAYDRALFDKPLGHVVQNRAIEEMQDLGCRWYLLGRRYFSSDLPTPTEKEISISEFKQGFATHAFPSFEFTHPSQSPN